MVQCEACSAGELFNAVARKNTTENKLLFQAKLPAHTVV